jgi:GntR family transcriptional regulator of vanillate catabolism
LARARDHELSGVFRGHPGSSSTTKATLGLRRLIVDGEVEPGERVGEVRFAERLGVSRTPLRIALSTLAHEGLVEQLPSGGFAVREFSRRELDDAIELRGVLEGAAARFAAERLESGLELAFLESVTDELDEVVADSAPEVIAARYPPLNDAFHEEVAQLAKSPQLERALAGCFVPPLASRTAFCAPRSGLQRAAEMLVVAQHQHRVLIEAIRRGHGTRAAEVAREHARLALLRPELLPADQGPPAESLKPPPLRGVV